MNLLKYVWRNITRNKLRSMLTILSVCFCLALMTVLHGYMAMQSVWKDNAGNYNRVVVMNTQGFAGAVPIATVERVRSVEGVVDAVPYAWYGGKYKDEQARFAQFATDADHAFNVWDEFKIDPAQLKAWQEDRQGCVVDRILAEDQGWKIGARSPLKGTFYQFDLDLKLVGLFDAPKKTGMMWFHWKYLDEGLIQRKAPRTGNAGTVFARAKSAAAIPEIVKTIDARFANSDTPTRTQTEQAFAQMFTDMLGNIQVFIQNIGIAVVFSLSLVAANGMAMSMRERTTEIAVLKAIGFARGQVLRMILSEACIICLIGGVFGIGLGALFLEGLYQIGIPMFPFGIREYAGPWMALLLLLAVAIGFASGLVPSIRAARLSVIDGLRRI